MESKQMEKYTDSLYYQIKLTEKICKIFCKQLEETLNLPITIDEFTILDIINTHNGEMHQRDLAKMLFKDRANTGKMLNKLEEKGYIIRKEETRNKRQVNIMTVTKEGKEIIKTIGDEIRPLFEKIENRISKEEAEICKRHMRNVRNVITESIEIDI